MHRACARYGLQAVGSATLPEQFPELLDVARLQLLDQAPSAELREVWLDLLINQTFRRDLFAKGVVPPSPAQWQFGIAQLPVHLRRESLQSLEQLTCSLGTIGLNAKLVSNVWEQLSQGPALLGDLADAVGLSVRALLPALSLLLDSDQIGIEFCSASGADLHAIQAFNHQLMNWAGRNQGLGGMLLPALHLPVRLSDVQLVLAYAASTDLSEADQIGLVSMSLQTGGLSVHGDTGVLLDQHDEVANRLAELRQSLKETGILFELRRAGGAFALES